MRIIYKKDTLEIVGVSMHYVTSHLPPASFGQNTTYIDIDYSERHVKYDPFYKNLHEQNEKLLGKTLIPHEWVRKFTFEDCPKPNMYNGIVVNILSFVPSAKMIKYKEQALQLGASVGINDVNHAIDVNIVAGEKEVGYIHCIKVAKDAYYYDKGETKDREFVPHYIGFLALIDHLKQKGIKWLDLGALTPEESGVNQFKRQWGMLMEVSTIHD